MPKLRHSTLLILLMGFVFANAQHIQAGDSLFALGFYQKAISEYQKSDLMIQDFKIAKVYESQGDGELALKYMEKYLKKDSLNTLVNFNYGKLLLQTKKFAKAVTVFKNLTQKHENPTYYYFLGISEENNINPVGAQKCFEKVVQLDDFHVRAHYKISVYLMGLKKWSEAHSYIDKMLQRNPENTDFIGLKADYFHGILEYKKAIEWNQKLLDFGIQDKNIYEKIAMAWMHAKEYQKSIDTFALLILMFDESDNANYQYYLGLNYGYLKNLKLAEKHLMLSKELNTATFEKEYFSIAYFNQEQGNLKKALQFYKKTIQEQPQYFEAHLQIAVILDQTSDDLKLRLATFETLKVKFPDMDEKTTDFVDYKIRAIRKEIHLKG